MTDLIPIRGADPATALPYIAQFDRLKAGLPGAGVAWVQALRERGAAAFAANGLPTVQNEAWRYTNLRGLAKIGFTPAGTAAALGIDALPTVRAEGAGPRLVFVDGAFRAELSSLQGLPDGVTLSSLSAHLAGEPGWTAEHLGRLSEVEAHPLAALNTAFLADGAALCIGCGVESSDPIELVFVSVGREDGATAFHPRLLIVAEANSRAVVVEHHIGLGSGVTLANHVAEISVGSGAKLHHYKVQRENAASFHLSHATVAVGKDAIYDSFILTLGGKLSRNEVRTALNGTGGTCRLNGAYMVRGDQHVDTTTFIDHAQPQCSSREVYKGAIDDHARAVFQGKILVRRGAQKTDGHQLNRALLLSDTAEIDSKPELEIYADDVKCSHGATAGELADEQLFYLRARGLSKDDARTLLIGAFLAEAVDEIEEEPVRDALQALVTRWLETR